ncbi:MAG: hypothetical protein AMK69_25740, partial [Nitrospira bacterium SG8_3]
MTLRRIERLRRHQKGQTCQNGLNLLISLKSEALRPKVGASSFEGVLVRNNHVRFIALGDRLRGVPEVMTLGVKPNFYDYLPHERDL